MTDGTKVTEPTSGTSIDTHQVDFGGGDVRQRQRIMIGGANAADSVAVTTTTPDNADPGLVTRLAGTASVMDAIAEGWLQELASHEVPLADADQNNFRNTPFAANETWTGGWSPYGQMFGMSTLVVMDSQPVSIAIEWSSDGINKDTSVLGTAPLIIQLGSGIPGTWAATNVNNIPVNRFFRLKIVNGPTAGTAINFTRMWRLRAPFGGTFSPVVSTPSNFSVALLTRAIQSGIAPDGTFVNVPLGGHDPANSTQVGLGAGATFQGPYRPALGYASMLVLAVADQPFTTARIDWSPDGINPTQGIVATSDLIGSLQAVPSGIPGVTAYVYLITLTTMVDKFYRLTLVNGPTAQSVFHQADVFVYDKPFPGSYGSITGALSPISTALLTRAVQSGTLPDGTFKNAVYGGVDPSQTTSTPLATGGTFTAPWVSVEGFADIGCLVTTDVPGTAFFDYSMDGVTQHRTAAYPVGGGTNAEWFSAAPRGKYFRLRYLNDGTGQTVFKTQVMYAASAFGNQFGQLNQAPDDTTIVSTSRAITAGRKPDGSYVNQPETGVSADNNTTAPLAAGGNFTGGWEVCDQHADIGINVRSDQPSAFRGLIVEFSQDGIAVDRQERFTYLQAPLGTTFAVPVQARYYRINYTNDGTDQTVFRLQTRLIEAALDGTTSPLNEGITDDTMAQLSRAVLAGLSPNGFYTNVFVSNTGALRTEPEPLPNILITPTTVGTAAVQIATGNFQQRRTISIKADPNNTGTVYLGLTSAVTTATGFPLAFGESVEFDIATGQNFYCIATNTNQKVVTLEVGA